jgi:hypothetical protein
MLSSHERLLEGHGRSDRIGSVRVMSGVLVRLASSRTVAAADLVAQQTATPLALTRFVAPC